MTLKKSINLILVAAMFALAATGCQTRRGTIAPLRNSAHPLPPPPENPIVEAPPPRVIHEVERPSTGTDQSLRGNQDLSKAPPVTDDDRLKTSPLPVPLPATNDIPANPITGLHEPNSGDRHLNWVRDTELLRPQTIYFDFDKSTVRSGEESKLAAVADYLRAHAEAALLVEGNCDERGTEEYNRSLGERRSLAAREILIQLGIAGSRIDTLAYGEDRPAEPGHNEAAWSKNRRDDFVVLTPPKP